LVNAFDGAGDGCFQGIRVAHLAGERGEVP
jgi:hypothetical protein